MRGVWLQAAQARREEKKKAEKEKLMLETDPSKTRKIEVRGAAALGIYHSSEIPSLPSLPRSLQDRESRRARRKMQPKTKSKMRVAM